MSEGLDVIVLEEDEFLSDQCIAPCSAVRIVPKGGERRRRRGFVLCDLYIVNQRTRVRYFDWEPETIEL